MKGKLAIYGPYPPPLGGMSVHIKRMEHFLIDAGIPYTIFNHGYEQMPNVIPTKKRFFFYLKVLCNRNFRLFHFHQIFFFEFLFYFIFSHINRTPLFVTIHAETLLNCRKVNRNIALFLLKRTRCIRVISVSKSLYDLLLKNSNDAVLLPAYVPPGKINFIAIEKDKRIHFLFSLWKFTADTANGSYNVPLVFEFLKRHKQAYRMVLMVGDEKGSDKKYLNELLKSYGIENAVLTLYGKNLVDYVQNCSFLLRANIIDGYGVSLQEALDLGVPAVASDTCARPKGTVLFKNNDLEDMIKKINYVMSQSKEVLFQDKENLTDHLKLLEMYSNNL